MGPAQRIVSLDLCADQYVLALANRDQIAAVSPDATKSFSFEAEAAAGLPAVSARLESVLALKPDLVVRSYGGGPDAARLLEKAGVRVLQLDYAQDWASIAADIKAAGQAFGQMARAQGLATQLEAVRLPPAEGPRASGLYVTPGGATTGPGTLTHAMLEAGGLANYEQRAGWPDLPLEALVRAHPDWLVLASFGDGHDRPDPWSMGHHRVFQAMLARTPVIKIEGAWTACQTWSMLRGVAAIRQALPAQPPTQAAQAGPG